MKVRALLVDDEPLARKRLRRLLGEHEDVTIVGEAGDGAAACAMIAELKPVLVFLDVQMPGMSGFDVLTQLAERPAVIFVTAHDEFAVRAFEEEAVDYLLKPVEPQRLARALARTMSGPRVRVEQDERLGRLLRAIDRAGMPSRRIPVRRGATVILVDTSAIVFCRAEDKYTVIYTADGEYVVDRTIEELERTLDPDRFLRIHRSAIVNLAFVKELTAVEGGRFRVTLTAPPPGTQLFASRAGARLLREKFGF